MLDIQLMRAEAPEPGLVVIHRTQTLVLEPHVELEQGTVVSGNEQTLT